MIEVNLYSIPADDFNSRVGRCIARNRFDRETIGTSIEDFLKGFLKDNLDKIESKLGIGDISPLSGNFDISSKQSVLLLFVTVLFPTFINEFFSLLFLFSVTSKK